MTYSMSSLRYETNFFALLVFLLKADPIGNPFGSKAESDASKSMSTLPRMLSWLHETRVTIDATFDDVPTYVGVSSPVDDSRITGVGKISGRSRLLMLMVYPPGELDRAWMAVRRAMAEDLKNREHTCLYPTSFMAKAAVMYPEPCLLRDSTEKGELAVSNCESAVISRR